jgi:ferric-dicitrate binding protein FerR (iron transport regulator)
MNMARWLLLMLALGLPAVAGAQEAFRDARIRYVEPGVSVQRASETGAEEALPNLPFLPGDRVWTDQGGRAEIQFADGTVLRVDSRSKLDYVAREREDVVVLRLWSGGLYVHGRNPGLSIETPGGVVEIGRGGVYRVDVDSGEARLSVYEGEARLDSARVRSGERAYARRGEAVEGPERFDRAAGDEFARWDEDRGERDGRAEARPEYLPEEIAPYAGELESSGTWYYESEVGHVWRPHVGPGWQPYSDGRWIWTAYGWTWVPYEGWGWAPFHYGRWGRSASLGWYWIPSAGWGPAWVSWAVGPSYVGWCPLGYRDRPTLVYGRRDRGRAVARGEAVAASNPWTFVRPGDLGARDLSQRRVDAAVDLTRDVRVVDSPRVRLTRDMQLSDAERAVPRSIRTKPGPGDTIPPLRSDPRYAIPAPLPRQQHESEREQDAERRRPSPRNERTAAPAERAVAPAPPTERMVSPAPLGRSERIERSHPTDVRSAPAGAVAIGRPRVEERRASPAGESPDREVMRPVFRPLGRSEGERERPASTPDRGEVRSGAERRRPDDTPRTQPNAPPRSERPPEARPTPRAQSPQQDAAARRKKDN